jgi:hypothetical protein
VIRVAKVRSRVLVIDASIARAAGDVSMNPPSRNCREFLQSVLELCHRMAMTDPIQEEWKKHQSRFARRWQVSMMARRKVVFVEIASHLSLENRISRVESNEVIAAVMEKDRRLVEAALVTEERVISLDDRMRQHLQDHVARLSEVRSICWVNPCTPEEKAIAWLEAGAPAERSRMLGHQRKAES